MILLKALFIFFCPSVILRCIKTKGFYLGKSSKIGFSIIKSRVIKIGDNSRIGHLNLIHVDTFTCGEKTKVGYLNVIRGNIEISLGENVEIYKQNKISAPFFNVSKTHLKMFDCARIAVGHLFDVTHDISIGSGSIFAGVGSQVWTHSFYYSPSSRKRIRVDKPVIVGDSCYIGSSVIVCPGVKIGDGITIGAGACVSKSVEGGGLYVNSPLRFIESFNADNVITGMGESEYHTDDYDVFH